MSDPRKNFVCPKCYAIINDKYRKHGKQTKCPSCYEIELRKKIREKLK